MRVRITRKPMGVVDGISLRHYEPGRAYEVTTLLAEYLVMQGYASVEMRQRDRSARTRQTDRRRGRARR